MTPADTAARYLDVLSQRSATAPRDMALVETTALYGLGGAAVLFLLFAIVRRSPGAAVSFSLITLTGLIVGIMTGRFAFLPTGTAVLILSLYGSAVLLFLTACVRIARDNPVLGAVVLVSILSLIALGGASTLGLTDGIVPVSWGLVGVAVFALSCVLFDLVRGDRAAIALLPGVAVASLSPLPVLAISQSSPWWQVALPLQMLAGGTLLACVTALFLATPISSPRARKTRANAMPSYADDHAFFGEVPDQPGGPRPLNHAPISAPASPPSAPQVDGGQRRPPAGRPIGVPLFAPAVSGGPLPQESDAMGRGSYEPEPLEPADPASSQWGGTDTVVPRARVAADEYVWDAMANPDVRVGEDALRLLGFDAGQAIPPEALREALSPTSLDAFDDDLLGGPDPRPGPFRATLTLHDGSGFVMDGHRQVDADGIVSRLAARVEAAPTRVAAPLAAPLRAGSSVNAAARALELGEIAAHFQPIVRLSDRQTVGFEALARWVQPSGTVIAAQDFVPDLIEAGRGLDLAERIASDAARELGAWLSAQPGQGQFVSLNIAAMDLARKGLSSLIERVVSDNDLPAGALVVELGEDRIKASASVASAAAKAIRQAGASLAVDDFGAGHANLARMAKYRFDMVKTDQSLARDLLSDKKARQTLKSVISVAHKTKIPVIAEGVEDEATARALSDMGCDFGQGYLFGAPEPAGGPPTAAAPRQAAAGLR